MALTEAGRDLADILTPKEPFGPLDSDRLFTQSKAAASVLVDPHNLVFEQARAAERIAYIIGRKGAGKTAFLQATSIHHGERFEALYTPAVYGQLATLVRRYSQARGQLYATQIAQLWRTMIDHVCIFHLAVTRDEDRDPEAPGQVIWRYISGLVHPVSIDATTDASDIAERCLRRLGDRIDNPQITGLGQLIDGLRFNDISFAEARAAMIAIGSNRPKLLVVMDNLEELHEQLEDLRPVLAGHFRMIAQILPADPYFVRICLPSELWEDLLAISSNPEKDFDANYLPLFWSAHELLTLVARRYRMFLSVNHPDQLNALSDKVNNARDDVELLRAALGNRNIKTGLSPQHGEDPIGYILRHTQLLPRHLILLLNRIFTGSSDGSLPWAVSPKAIVEGVREGEKVILNGIFSAHAKSYRWMRDALQEMAGRVGPTFRVSDGHEVFNKSRVKKLMDGGRYDDFIRGLIHMGLVGVAQHETEIYQVAHFQYTFDTQLNWEEGVDSLSFHPVVMRLLFERSFSALRKAGAKPTYPYGTGNLAETEDGGDNYRNLLDSPYRRR